MEYTEPKFTLERTPSGRYIGKLESGHAAIIEKDGNRWVAREAYPNFLDLGDEEIITGYTPFNITGMEGYGKTRKEALLDALIMYWYK